MNDSTSQSLTRLTDQADQARSLREFGVAIGWLDSAGRLETSEQQRDIKSAVNQRLVALIFDAATYSEDLVLRCGNFTREHIGWVTHMREISNVLLKRLEGGDPQHDAATAESLSRVVLVSGHVNALYTRFIINSHDKLLLPNPVKDIKKFADTVAEIRSQAAQMAGDLCVERTQLLQLITLGNALGNASSHVLSFPIKFFSDYEAALFFAEQAVRYAAQISSGPKASASQSEIDSLNAVLASVVSSLKEREHNASKQHLANAYNMIKHLSGVSHMV